MKKITLFTIFASIFLIVLPLSKPIHAQSIDTDCGEGMENKNIQIIQYGIFTDKQPPYTNRTNFVLRLKFDCPFLFAPILHIDSNTEGWLGLPFSVSITNVGLQNENQSENEWETPFALNAVAADFQGEEGAFKIYVTNDEDDRIPISNTLPGSITDTSWVNLIDGNTIQLKLEILRDSDGDPVTAGPLSCGDYAPVGLNTPTCPDQSDTVPCCPSSCPAIKTETQERYFCGYDRSSMISPEPSPPPPLQPCQTAAGELPKNCNTALGIISSDPGGFVTSILGILMSISGMLALFFIVRSGYQLMMSRGNPEAIQEARERLTSAIVGLLLIIFSLVILSVIGVDLLKIPGFGE